MEFDTSVRLRTMESFDVASGMSPDEFCRSVWEAASSQSGHVGEGGGFDSSEGAFSGASYWLDYSTRFQTRHILVEITPADPDEGYHVRISAGTTPSYLWDILAGLAALAAAWCLGKVFRPAPAVGFYFDLAASAAVLVWLAFEYGKAFGSEEAGKLKKAILSI